MIDPDCWKEIEALEEDVRRQQILVWGIIVTLGIALAGWLFFLL